MQRPGAGTCAPVSVVSSWTFWVDPVWKADQQSCARPADCGTLRAAGCDNSRHGFGNLPKLRDRGNDGAAYPGAGVLDIEEPFPLKARFWRRVVPAFFILIGISLAIMGFTARTAIESIYLELAQKRAQTIVRSVRERSGPAWENLMSGASVEALRASGEYDALVAAFAAETRNQALDEVKVYDLARVVLYATQADEIGTVEDGDALKEVITELDPGIVTKTLPNGSAQYELYVPVFNRDGELGAVFELYEPVDYLDAIIVRSAIPILSIPGVLLLLLGLALSRLVHRAQADINARTAAINDLRRRVESLVSEHAVDAARQAGTAGELPSRRITTTLLFSDIRDFTGFSESNDPGVVVDFLNAAMTLQVNIIAAHGGDVDKMIGDAVLAQFDGERGGEHALKAAFAIQEAWAAEGFPRPAGIGVCRGEVISGTIGPQNRRDYTVIGDTVNIAARLCSAAAGGEIVVEAELAGDAQGEDEELAVKGRKGLIKVRRIPAVRS